MTRKRRQDEREATRSHDRVCLAPLVVSASGRCRARVDTVLRAARYIDTYTTSWQARLISSSLKRRVSVIGWGYWIPLKTPYWGRLGSARESRRTPELVSTCVAGRRGARLPCGEFLWVCQLCGGRVRVRAPLERYGDGARQATPSAQRARTKRRTGAPRHVSEQGRHLKVGLPHLEVSVGSQGGARWRSLLRFLHRKTTNPCTKTDHSTVPPTSHQTPNNCTHNAAIFCVTDTQTALGQQNKNKILPSETGKTILQHCRPAKTIGGEMRVTLTKGGCGYNSSSAELSTPAASPVAVSVGFCSTNSSACFPSPASPIVTPESPG